MAKLECDNCGGSIIYQSDGRTGICDSCGASHTVDPLAELRSRAKKKEEERQRQLEEENERKRRREAEVEQRAYWIRNKLCRHCGGEFEGRIFKKCKNCGHTKDY